MKQKILMQIHSLKFAMKEFEGNKKNEIVISKKFEEHDANTSRKGETVTDFKFIHKIKV